MSDPTEPGPLQIPNLLETLRASRGRGGRRRGRGGHVASSQQHDAVIQGTDTDAAVSRLSAVDMGYMNDPYAALFVQSADGPSPRRLPIINRGSYTRTRALDRLVDLFLSEPGQKQIISLGAGTDTRPFRLFSRKAPSERLCYHEIDFEVISEKKLWTVQTSQVLRNIFINPTRRGDGWVSMLPRGPYYCHGIDLRTLADGTTTTLPGLRTDIPTLLLSECCLCYLEPTDASNVIKFFTSQIPNIGIAIYEPIKPQDAFGKMMVSNLAARNIQMPTLHIYREAADQEQRLRDAEFTLARHMTIDQIWEDWVPAEEKYRLDIVEGLDEVEEWKLLANHYGVVWGSRGSGFQRWESLGQGA